MAPINPAIARDLGNGNHFCMICNISVKTKTWTAHSTGRQHRDNIQKLKAQAGALQQKAIPKRPAENGAAVIKNEPVAKKAREDFDAPESSTPWERERHGEEKKGEAKPKKKVAEKVKGLPEDFFEVKQTPQSSATSGSANVKHLDAELAQFDKEVKQIDTEQLRQLDEPEEVEEELRNALTQDIDEVVDNIARWKRINHLEIKLDDVKQQIAGKQNDRMEEDDMETDSDDDDLVLNWRSAKFT